MLVVVVVVVVVVIVASFTSNLASSGTLLLRVLPYLNPPTTIDVRELIQCE